MLAETGRRTRSRHRPDGPPRCPRTRGYRRLVARTGLDRELEGLRSGDSLAPAAGQAYAPSWPCCFARQAGPQGEILRTDVPACAFAALLAGQFPDALSDVPDAVADSAARAIGPRRWSTSWSTAAASTSRTGWRRTRAAPADGCGVRVAQPCSCPALCPGSPTRSDADRVIDGIVVESRRLLDDGAPLRSAPTPGSWRRAEIDRFAPAVRALLQTLRPCRGRRRRGDRPGAELVDQGGRAPWRSGRPALRARVRSAGRGRDRAQGGPLPWTRWRTVLRASERCRRRLLGIRDHEVAPPASGGSRCSAPTSPSPPPPVFRDARSSPSTSTFLPSSLISSL